MSNNYDMAGERAVVDASQGTVPTHHVWGALELEELGHVVDFVPAAAPNSVSAWWNDACGFGDPAQQLFAWRRRRQYDVLYCGNPNPHLWLAGLRRHRILQLPMVVVLLRAYAPTTAGRLFVDRFLAGFDHLLCLSEPIRALMARDYPALGDRLTFLPWGIDLVRYDRADRQEAAVADGTSVNQPVFITAGKTYRDIDALFSAFAGLSARLEVHYGSDHPNAKHWRELAAGARPANVALIAASFGWRYIRAINRRARAVLVPLGLPQCDRYATAAGLTSMVDAMAAARPLIVTRTKSPVIDVEGEGIGLFVEDNSPEAWARAIKQMANDADLAAQMGLRARQLCERRYNTASFARGLEQALLKAARRDGRPLTSPAIEA